MALRWWADDDPLLVDPLSARQLKKNSFRVGPPLTKLSGSANELKYTQTQEYN